MIFAIVTTDDVSVLLTTITYFGLPWEIVKYCPDSRSYLYVKMHYLHCLITTKYLGLPGKLCSTEQTIDPITCNKALSVILIICSNTALYVCDWAQWPALYKQDKWQYLYTVFILRCCICP